ncbi:MAG: FHA domain-containing protein FhaB/FipA [Actinomycetota bacterium]
MPPFVLTILKVLFLALLYFFVYRAIRSVVVDLRAETSQPVARGREAPARPRRGKAKPPKSIVVLDERGNKVNTVRLGGTIQIGRAEACQIQCSDTYVSSFHARVFSRDGAWYVEDLGSTNGTYLNQRRVTSPAELRAGDRVQVGKTTLELRR